MADQVNPTGSLVPGPSLTFMAVKPTSVQEKPPAAKPAKPAKPAEPAPKGTEGWLVDESAKTLETAVKEVSALLQTVQSNLVFQVDESSGHTFFKVVDAETKEVIRQVPSEEIMAMARKLREVSNPKGAPGVLVDKEG